MKSKTRINRFTYFFVLVVIHFSSCSDYEEIQVKLFDLDNLNGSYLDSFNNSTMSKQKELVYMKRGNKVFLVGQILPEPKGGFNNYDTLVSISDSFSLIKSVLVSHNTLDTLRSLSYLEYISDSCFKVTHLKEGMNIDSIFSEEGIIHTDSSNIREVRIIDVKSNCVNVQSRFAYLNKGDHMFESNYRYEIEGTHITNIILPLLP